MNFAPSKLNYVDEVSLECSGLAVVAVAAEVWVERMVTSLPCPADI